MINTTHIAVTSKVAFLQKEYRNSYQSLARCQYTLTGMKDKIPLLMADGSYKTGAKFINTKDDDFEGSLIRRLIVDDSCKDLAKFLRLGSIRDIHYSDIDFEIDEITDDDVEDLDVLNNYAEIARSLRLNGLLSEDQIDYYNLGYADTTPSGNDEIQSEEFPDQPIKDQYRLRNHIHSEWDNKNPYEERTYTVWRPHTQISEQKEYVLSTYRSRNNPRYCFCQMCGKITSAHYIEVRSIEREPVYAWPQMNLCLCLNCSKDYVVLRSNNTIWNRFIRDMMDADPRYQHTIKIGDQQKITFTATHLAEVQIRQHIHAAQRAARMAGGCVMHHLHAQQTRSGGLQLQLLQFGFFHTFSFLCCVLSSARAGLCWFPWFLFACACERGFALCWFPLYIIPYPDAFFQCYLKKSTEKTRGSFDAPVHIFCRICSQIIYARRA